MNDKCVCVSECVSVLTFFRLRSFLCRLCRLVLNVSIRLFMFL